MQKHARIIVLDSILDDLFKFVESCHRCGGESLTITGCDDKKEQSSTEDLILISNVNLKSSWLYRTSAVLTGKSDVQVHLKVT